MSADPATWRYFPIRHIPLFSKEKFPEYWDEGLAYDEGKLNEWVKTPGNRMAILSYPSGLVIIDCDVEYRWVDNGLGVMVHGRVRDGLADLKRVAGELNQQITPTRAVRTPSGGTHFYYTQNSYCNVTSHGHRDGWHIDVKASPHVYAICPPTPGYEVIRDLPVAVLPYWLARYICRQYPKPAVTHHAESMSDRRVAGILAKVAEAAESGGWNNTAYWAACRFAEAEWDFEQAAAAITSVTPPRRAHENKKLLSTIRSAFGRASTAF